MIKCISSVFASRAQSEMFLFSVLECRVTEQGWEKHTALPELLPPQNRNGCLSGKNSACGAEGAGHPALGRMQ